jgi:growth factor-regulated tyrosine kinase substrate
MENIQLFSTLMHRIQSIGGDVSGDQQVNQLYTEIGSLQPKLVTTLNEACQKHGKYIEMTT